MITYSLTSGMHFLFLFLILGYLHLKFEIQSMIQNWFKIHQNSTYIHIWIYFLKF